MKSFPWVLTFDPGLNASQSCLVHFTVLLTLDAFWFVDFSFLSLFSQEVVKTALCVYVCFESTLALVFLLQLFCGMLQDGRSLSKQEVKILSTTFLKTWHTSFFYCLI